MYKQKLEQLEKDLKAIDFYITTLKNKPKDYPTLAEIRQWEVKYRRTMIRYRTLVINNNEAA